MCTSGLLHFHLCLPSLPTSSRIIFLNPLQKFPPKTSLCPHTSTSPVNYIISSISHILNFSTYIFPLPYHWWANAGGPTSLKMENIQNVLLSSSATHLGPSPPPPHHHTLISPSVLGQAWAGELLPLEETLLSWIAITFLCDTSHNCTHCSTHAWAWISKFDPLVPCTQFIVFN